jgi:hypothetical protein
VASWLDWWLAGVLQAAPEPSSPVEVPPPEPVTQAEVGTDTAVPLPVEVPPPATPGPAEASPPGPSAGPTPRPIASGGVVGIDLEWRAPAGCPSSDRVVAVIAALVARDVVLDPTAAVVVRASVVAEGSGWGLDLEVDGPGGAERRHLQASRCEVLGEAAALVIATNVDPAQVARTLDQAEARPEGAAVADVPPATARDRSRPSPVADASARRRVGVALLVLGGPAIGMTPKVTGWLQGDVHVSIGRAVIGAHAGHGFARRADGDASLRAAMTTGGVRGCFAPTQGRLAVPLCGLFEAGAVTARAEGDNARRARGLWLGAGAGAAVEWSPHPRVALVGGVDALVAIVRPEFRAEGPDGTTADYRAAPAAVRATLGISVRLR